MQDKQNSLSFKTFFLSSQMHAIKASSLQSFLSLKSYVTKLEKQINDKQSYLLC